MAFLDRVPSLGSAHAGSSVPGQTEPPTTLSDVQVIDFPGFPTAVVRGVDQPTADMHTFMDSAFTALGGAIARGEVTPVGPAFSRYDGDVRHGLGDTVDLEVGFPLAAPLAGPVEMDGVRVEPSSLPACRLATAKHTGPYEGLPQAWPAFITQVQELGGEPGDVFWEAYDTEPGPGVDPATLVTGLAVPVHGTPALRDR